MSNLRATLGTSRYLVGLGKVLALGTLLTFAGGCQKAAPPQPPVSETAASASAPAPSNETPGAATDQAPVTSTLPTPPAETAPPPTPIPEAPPPAPVPVVVPAGTRITVRLDSTLSSKTSQVGEQFSATIAKAVRVKGIEIFGSQAAVVGKVIDAKAAGKFAGASSLGLRLESVSDHHVVSTAYSQHVDGKGERTALVIGGTALAGALLGGLAGHGKGALIGGAAGGGVGTLGAAETGNNRDIVLPAGSVLTFKLTKALTLDSSPKP